PSYHTLSLHDALPILGASAGRGTAAPPASGSGEVCVMAPLWHDRPTARGRRGGGVEEETLWRDGESCPTGLPPARSRSYDGRREHRDRKSTRLNSSHVSIPYAVFCLTNKT